MRRWRYPELWRNALGVWCPSQDRSRSTVLTDRSGTHRHGTLTNMDPATDWTAEGMDFDGTDDYVSFANTSFGVQKTISLWVRLRSNKDQWFMSNRPAGAATIHFQITQYPTGGTNYLQFAAYADGGASYIASPFISTAPPLNEWIHLGLVFSQSGILSYYQGQQTGNYTLSSGVWGTSSQPFRIGAASWASGLYVNGQIDDVRINEGRLGQNYMQLLASRRGVAFETVRSQSRRISAAPTFKAAWLNQRSQIIGGGVR